jgi:NTE family protein
VVGGLSEQLRAQLTTETTHVALRAGEWLFREGEPADNAYLVRSGRLEVVIEHPSEIVIRHLKRGALVGELALLTYGVRTASVRASRDSELTELGRERFEGLIRESPEFALGLIQVMGSQIAANRAPEGRRRRPRTFAVIALDPGAPAQQISAELAARLARHGSVDQLSPADGYEPSDFSAVLERAESANDRVLLAGGSHDPSDKWVDFSLREADLVLAVTSGAPASAWTDQPARLQGSELVVIDGDLAVEHVSGFGPRELHLIRSATGRANSVAIMARRFAGQSLGLVLSGGGARALAHLGVLDELAAAGLVVDRLGGVSMGAIISGIAAIGSTVPETAEILQRQLVDTNPSNDYTLPAYSLIRGQKTRRLLAETFGDRRIEELTKRWFCVSADLASRELIVHRTGPIVDAVYSSMAIPGVYPPMPLADGRLLVDGGVIDNLPVGPMAERREGPIIAVDVSLRDGNIPQARRPRMQPLARLVRRAVTGSAEQLPRLPETILRTIALGGADTVAAAMQHADIVISPKVEGIGLLDWQQLPHAREVGREAARAALEHSIAKLESWKSADGD